MLPIHTICYYRRRGDLRPNDCATLDGLLHRVAPAGDVAAAFPELTNCEQEILDKIVQGRTNQGIAADLVVSLKTVRNHVSNILSKLHVADRAQATNAARKAGLGADCTG